MQVYKLYRYLIQDCNGDYMKKCKNCDALIRDNDKYCRNCGIPLHGDLYILICNIFTVFIVLGIIFFVLLFIASYFVE